MSITIEPSCKECGGMTESPGKPCQDCEEYMKTHSTCCPNAYRDNWDECDICPDCKEHSCSQWEYEGYGEKERILAQEKFREQGE